jgi:DNA excision repair protein ERCC-2
VHADILLTYLELESGEIIQFQEQYPIGSLETFFRSVIDEYLVFISDHHRWLQARDRSIAELSFPFKTYRTGQRSLAVAAYRTIKGRGRLFAEAPTGIGKTISVLFPAIKAMGQGEVGKIFYLTAKTIGRTVAEKNSQGSLRQRYAPAVPHNYSQR